MVKALREILGIGLFLLVSAMYVSPGWKEYFVLKKGMKTAGVPAMLATKAQRTGS